MYTGTVIPTATSLKSHPGSNYNDYRVLYLLGKIYLWELNFEDKTFDLYLTEILIDQSINFMKQFRMIPFIMSLKYFK